MSKIKVILYAPNVHTGGGLVLLQELLRTLRSNYSFTAILDERSRMDLSGYNDCVVKWVSPNLASRAAAEILLRRMSSRVEIVICFHGLPPLLPNRAMNYVFLQNVHYINRSSLRNFKFKTAIRLAFERTVAWIFRKHVSAYFVQTASMGRAVTAWYGIKDDFSTSPIVKIRPFMSPISTSLYQDRGEQSWDFVYVADGETHKNHMNLVAAWRMLAEAGIKPSLALTLGDRDKILWIQIEEIAKTHGLNISNLGNLPHSQVMSLYKSAGALVFPSFSESFGLPLVEAALCGLPIVASETDYVRDVCVPVETFDPASPVSIYRAIRRFLGCSEQIAIIGTSDEFMESMFSCFYGGR